MNNKTIDIEQSIVVAITTTSNLEEAKKIANSLVAQHLVACVQLTPITSIYTWNESIEEEEEIRLMIKLVKERQEEVVQYLKQHHPYDTPEIILTDFQSEKSYYDWCQRVSQ